MDELDHTSQQKQPQLNVGKLRWILIMLGTAIFALVTCVPIWGAGCLFWDPVYILFSGRGSLDLIIILCVGAVLGYAGTAFLMFKFDKYDMKAEKKLLMVYIVFQIGLGLGFVVISSAMLETSRATYVQLVDHCGSSGQTQAIQELWQKLQKLRQTPDCMALPTIELCPGFEPKQPYASFLKNVETEYKCSGFCSNYVPANGGPDSGPVSLHAHDSAHVQRQVIDETPKRLLSFSTRVRRQALRNNQNSSNVQEARFAQIRHAYTLFSDANYETNCDGAAAHAIRFHAMETSQTLYLEGVILLLIAVGTMMVTFVGACVRQSLPMAQIDFYGSTTGKQTHY